MSGRPLLVDLFGGEGGAAMGYYRAGFDVLGVDMALVRKRDGSWGVNSALLRNYPFPMVRADALEFLASANLARVSAIHASPVCKRYSSATPERTRASHPDQIGPTRALLRQTGLPWVIENVPGAPLRPDFRLCGCVVGLHELERERWFETSWHHAPELQPPCYHASSPITVAGHGEPSGPRMAHGHIAHKADWERVMGIDWMSRDGLAQAIPPAYTEHIGLRLMNQVLEIAA